MRRRTARRTRLTVRARQNAHNLRGADISEFVPLLSVDERRLFDVGQRAFAQMRAWQSGGGQRLEASRLAVAANSTKRRRP